MILHYNIRDKKLYNGCKFVTGTRPDPASEFFEIAIECGEATTHEGGVCLIHRVINHERHRASMTALLTKFIEEVDAVPRFL